MSDLSERNSSLDFLKFMAAVFISNSHFIPLYKDVNIGFATLGVHGNALFFFVSGFLLMMGFKKKTPSFANWYKRKIQRLWPAVFLWVLISSVLWGDLITWQNILFAPRYWFLQCIVVYYALFFFVGKYMLNNFRGGNAACLTFLCAVLISVISALWLPKSGGSLFHSSWHYVCHFSVMIAGALTYACKDKIKYRRYGDILWLSVSFIAYFLILSIGKGKTDWRYYTQITALLPLHTFCFYAYKVCCGKWCEKLLSSRYWRWPFVVVSSLTLEIYIVQFHIITDRFNAVFPLNWIIVFILICIAAYVLRICVNIFVQFMRKEDWDARGIFSL